MFYWYPRDEALADSVDSQNERFLRGDEANAVETYMGTVYEGGILQSQLPH